MRTAKIRLMLTLVLIVSALPILTAAAPGSDVTARAEHQRIVEFWTPERVAQAVPRSFVFDPGSQRFLPQKGKPGGTPGGGGGGGSSVVSGASWNKGGEIDASSGKVLFSMGGSYYVCSATVIDDGAASSNGSALIITAAHCAYDEAGGAFSDNWMFIPDYDDNPASLTTDGSFCGATTHGCWTAEALVVHDGYASAGGFNDQAVLYDFAVVRVGAGGHSSDELDDVVTEQAYDFSSYLIDGSVTSYAFGYPAAKKWKGNDLIYCAGPIDGDPLNGDTTYRMNECKLTGGSSGGPWLADFDETIGSGTVMSVNSYGYTGINAMHGPVLNADTTDVYNAAKSGPSTIVP
ncbi:MAG: hypothetical protein ABFR95_03910 [Actinomycetota bacterium]